jgi:hypothetical protein
MISSLLANTIVIISLLVSLAAYIFVSKREGSYINILTPAYVVNIPAYFLFPIIYTYLFETEATPYAFAYVYATIAVENLVFAYFYTRRKAPVVHLPFAYGYGSFGLFGMIAVALSALVYLPVLLQFPQYIFSPRQIYEQTRTGFGPLFYLSSSLSYLAVILILFSKKSFRVKAFVTLVAAMVLLLHGSKGQVLSLLFLVLMFEIYVNGRRLNLLSAIAVAAVIGAVGLGLFAVTMILGTPYEAIETISRYSDYTRNATMLIDSNFPVQNGRLTLESNIISLIPRAIMPSKPKTFGALYLDEQFFPESIDEDVGSPDFGIGVQYADFGSLAILYLALFEVIRGWLALVFVNRLRVTRHPGDFVIVAFLAGISVFPVGGTGWLLPETLVVAMLLRFASCFGTNQIFRERNRTRRRPIAPPGLSPLPGAGSAPTA